MTVQWPGAPGGTLIEIDIEVEIIMEGLLTGQVIEWYDGTTTTNLVCQTKDNIIYSRLDDS